MSMNITNDQAAEVEAAEILRRMRDADSMLNYRVVAECFDELQTLIASGRIEFDRVYLLSKRITSGASA